MSTKDTTQEAPKCRDCHKHGGVVVVSVPETEPNASDVEPFLEDENPYVRGRAVE